MEWSNQLIQPAGWPQQFLLQILSDLTSNLTVFLFFIIIQIILGAVKTDNSCYVLNKKHVVPPVKSW